ncbi:11823_t:CDS:2 [Rhizophagus irregularis]|nr:11823_t:CDS:2 [Rhizophagus irregularis]
MVGQELAYKTIKIFTKKITDEEKAINELQSLTKRIKDNKLKLQTPEDMTIYTNERLTSSADAKRTNEEFRLFKCQKIRDENKENLDDEDNDSWALPSPTLQLLDNSWLLNYMKIEDFEELVEICYSHGAVEVPIELKNMLKTESHKSASIYYSLIDRLAIQYFHALRAGSSSESSSFTLHTVNANLHGKQPDIYFHDNILKIVKDDMIKDTNKYDLDTNKSLQENIYEIYYTYDSLPTSKKEKIFEMDFMSFVISDNHIDTYVTRLVDYQLYISTKVYDMTYPTEFAVNTLVSCMYSILKMVVVKVNDSDPLIDSPIKFKYFCDPCISPPIIPITTTEKSDSSKKNVNKNTNKKTKNK